MVEAMADVAQLVRALVCGTGGREFKSHYPPQDKFPDDSGVLFWFNAALLPL